MTKYYSPSTGGFYDDAIHGSRKIPAELTPGQVAAGRKPRMIDNPDCRLPDDAVAISEEQHAELMKQQANGKVIVARGNRPVAADPVRSPEEVAEENRRRRDLLLMQSDWTQLPDALLDEPDYKAAMALWRQALRDMDLSLGEFPAEPARQER